MTEFSFIPLVQRTSFVTILDGEVPFKVIEGHRNDNERLGGLRIAFSVERKATFDADTATIKIWNLSAATRASLAQRSLAFARRDPIRYVMLEAGYKDLNGVIFHGTIMRVTNTRDGPDWITEIDAMTAMAGLFDTTPYSIKSKSGVPVKTIVTELLQLAGFKKVFFSLEAEILLGGKFETSYAKMGSAYYGAAQLLNNYGLALLPDLGNVIVFQPGWPVDATVQDIDEYAGLVGTPKLNDLGADIRVLLNPNLLPGRKVQVVSQTIDASVGDKSLGRIFTIYNVSCKGDTHGNDWFSDLNCWYFPIQAEFAVGGALRIPQIIKRPF